MAQEIVKRLPETSSPLCELFVVQPTPNADTPGNRDGHPNFHFYSLSYHENPNLFRELFVILDTTTGGRIATYNIITASANTPQLEGVNFIAWLADGLAIATGRVTRQTFSVTDRKELHEIQICSTVAWSSRVKGGVVDGNTQN